MTKTNITPGVILNLLCYETAKNMEIQNIFFDKMVHTAVGNAHLCG